MITTSYKELQRWNACEGGLARFASDHGTDRDVMLCEIACKGTSNIAKDIEWMVTNKIRKFTIGKAMVIAVTVKAFLEHNPVGFESYLETHNMMYQMFLNEVDIAGAQPTDIATHSTLGVCASFNALLTAWIRAELWNVQSVHTEHALRLFYNMDAL